MFLGGIYLVLGFSIFFFIDYELKKKGIQSNTFIQFIQLLIIGISFFMAIKTALRNVIGIFKPGFQFAPIKIKKKTKRKEVSETYENIDKSYIGLENGVVFGKMRTSYLVMPQQTEGHIMVIGGQGSGKSSSVAIPTLLNYNSSIFAIDIKGELSEVRKKYNKGIVKVFDPLEPTAPHYDPYLILKDGDKVQGAREIVNSIIPISANEQDPYWKQSAQNLLTGCILHYEDEGKDFPTTCREILEKPVNELISLLQGSQVQEVKLFISQFIGADTKQLASIYSTLTNEIILFATDKDIMRALSQGGNRIAPHDLEVETDIFIKLSEDKLEQWKPLLNLMVSQFLKSFEKRQDKTDKKILFMIDEFPRLGKVKSITNGLSTLRSKGIQIMLIMQSLAQLDVIYGKDSRKVITDNCNYKIILNASDVDTQEYFSKLVGTVDIEKKSSSINSKSLEFDKNRGVSTSTEEKRIIKPEEFAYLENPVVFTPKGFFRPQKVKWYEDKIFLERANN